VKLAGRDIDNPIALAPLAGWTDIVFRRICKEFGADILFTEMASADAIVRNQGKTFDIIRFAEEERPLGIQLFGADAETLSRAVEIVCAFYPDFIDMNIGCPAKKVVKRGAGAALLRDHRLLRDIAVAVVKKSSCLVSAKVRSGWDVVNVIDSCRILQDAGIAFLSVHPRTQQMQFWGEADWSLIRDVKSAVDIPVLGNGDIKSAYDAEKMIKMTGCDGIMIGRAARGNPWIFRQVREYLRDGRNPSEPTFVERIRLCIEHLDRAKKAETGRGSMRKHISCYLKGLPGVSEVRAEIFSMKAYSEIRNRLVCYQNRLEEMADEEK
jgi:tRNA-dihydrouridine synthase B